jgi:hypothetical protein
MRKKFKSYATVVAGCSLAVLGGVVGFWPIQILALLVLAFGKAPISALGLGIFLDIVYGAPLGLFHYVYFPFTIASGIALIAERFSSEYIMETSPRTRF